MCFKFNKWFFQSIKPTLSHYRMLNRHRIFLNAHSINTLQVEFEHPANVGIYALDIGDTLYSIDENVYTTKSRIQITLYNDSNYRLEIKPGETIGILIFIIL